MKTGHDALRDWEERFDKRWWQIENPDTINEHANHERSEIKRFISNLVSDQSARHREELESIAVSMESTHMVKTGRYWSAIVRARIGI